MVGALVDAGAVVATVNTDVPLIALAERTGVTAIATIDQRDFSVYRLRGRKRFRILLS